MNDPFIHFQEASESSLVSDVALQSSSLQSSFRIIKNKRSTGLISNSGSQRSKQDPEQTGNFQKERIPLLFEQEAVDFIAYYEKKRKTRLLEQFVNDIRVLIKQDEFIDGELSKSEAYMREVAENDQIDFAIEALMEIYSRSLLDTHMLEGILSMISSVPYDFVYPKGQIMAMGLLSNKELSVRDKAIQCFERWNSKKGMEYLKSLHCHPRWLQKYVEKVMIYLEKDGEE